MPIPFGQLIIDLSVFQGKVDFDALVKWVAPDGRKIVGVITRCTNGDAVDTRFAENRAGAKAHGLYFGAYGVIYTAGDVVKQAKAYVNAIGHFDDNDLPPVMDWEVHGGGQEHDDAVKWVDIVEAGLARRVTIYTGPGFIASVKFPLNSPLVQRDLWVAHYTSAPHPAIPKPWTRWAMWQYAGDGSGGFPGIKGDVDKDVFNDDTDGDGTPGTLDDLKAFIMKSMIVSVKEIAPGKDSIIPDLRDALIATGDK